ncbi:unnamed protein product [Durusdinium trenchii]|uniref:Uncharacterized protein n=1 Tax=Durusdinium trenchii TaxID=1381693 RepID=A0ABP0RIC5_9DINO
MRRLLWVPIACSLYGQGSAKDPGCTLSAHQQCLQLGLEAMKAIDLVLLWVVVVIFARFERIVYAPKQEKVIWGHGAMTVAFDNEGSEDSRSFLQRSWQKMFPSQSSGHFAPHNVSQAYEAAREHQHNLHGHGEQTF